MDIEIIPVRTKSDIKNFIELPWKIYQGNKNWVPPLISDVKRIISTEQSNPDTFEKEVYIALLDGKTTGRIYLGIDKVLNSKKNEEMGHFSLFECINSHDVAKALFDTAISWFRQRGITKVRGPVSPTGADSDENKGLLIDSFHLPPVIMNSYNPEYYKELIENYGFSKDYDVYAYYLDPAGLFLNDPAKTIEYAKKRYGFRVDTLNLKNVEGEINSLKHVLDLAVPDEWPDMVAPSLEDVRAIAKKLIPVADPDIIVIARAGDDAIGFGIALPDYNQVLIHLKGKMTPLAIMKYLYYKRKITGLRFFIMFVVPEFRKKGVSYALYYQVFKNGINKGYRISEGSTIGETNL
ncbi:MAG: hypothetical protein Q8920_14965, partial [Bacillota bacterium]|nr:hypothetical protein [Bacillota bacterium]